VVRIRVLGDGRIRVELGLFGGGGGGVLKRGLGEEECGGMLGGLLGG